MALPSEYFNNSITIPSDDPFLASSPDIIKEINLDNINLEDFLKDKSSETLPGLTITPAPKAQTNTQNTPEAPLQQKQGPSKEESDKLDELEKILAGLEEKINELNSSEGDLSNEPTKLTAEQLLEQKLNEPLGDETDQVEVAQPQNFNNFETVNNSVIDNRNYNDEKIKQYLEQKDYYLQQREEILKNFNNNITNENISNILNTENVNSNVNTDNFNNLDTNTIKENILNQNEATANNLNNLTQNINNERIESNILNTGLPQSNLEVAAPETPLTSTINAESIEAAIPNVETDKIIEKNNLIERSTEKTEPVFFEDGGIVTEPISNAVIGEAGPEAVIPLNDANMQEVISSSIGGPESELPGGEDVVGKNTSEISSILKNIESAIKGLGESLDNKFLGLNESVKGIKSSSVNNSYNSNKSDTTQMNSNQIGQRNTMPNYVGEYPVPEDFPQGFDVAKLGGTNLPNPQYIT